MPAPLILPVQVPPLTGNGSAGVYDEIVSPVFTSGLVLQNRNATRLFFIGNSAAPTAFKTVQLGEKVTISGDGTPRKVRFFLGGVTGEILEFLAYDDRDS